MDEFSFNIYEYLIKILTYGIPMLFAITLHEASHAYAAKRMGDPTAFILGRMTLNPIKHIDPIGTVVLPILLLFTGAGFLFGWAKPVPINTRMLPNPRKDMLWIALAGPMANLVMAIIWVLIWSMIDDINAITALGKMARIGVILNLSLMIFNLVPIPPLDGGRILVGLLPPRLAQEVDKIEPYGMLITIALVGFNVITPVIMQILHFFMVHVYKWMI